MLLLLLTLWSIYFILHSLLASLAVKHWFSTHFPKYSAYYRLGFNLFASLLLLPLLLFTLWLGQEQPLWLDWQGAGYWVAKLLSISAIVMFIISLRYYDMSHFLGLKQCQQTTAEIEEAPFSLSPFHRFVRHPWYSLGLVIIWTHNMDIYLFSVALLCTLYFIIGVYFEEQKLHHYYGNIYQRYTQSVPALVPIPWRYLTHEQATQLLKSR